MCAEALVQDTYYVSRLLSHFFRAHRIPPCDTTCPDKGQGCELTGSKIPLRSGSLRGLPLKFVLSQAGSALPEQSQWWDERGMTQEVKGLLLGRCVSSRCAS
ncbi:unnamed protein product [Gulo gulo]|uniref:Uncharacterized protein n=1 Tax=Gulo gulo TaxID=48420 RepID=A0A9X9LUQ5_GULGU|nr:unnamed protein product [Gulo gulo]